MNGRGKFTMRSFILLLLAVISLLMWIEACTDQGTQPAAPPAVTALQLDSAAVGDTIKVEGTNFGASRGSSVVSFGSVAATVYPDWTSSEIRVKVPAGATSGPVTVTVDGTMSNAVQFKVVVPLSAPLITSISPGSLNAGDTLQLTGLRFGATQSTSAVVFPTNSGTVNGAVYPSWNATSVKVVVPVSAIRGIVYLEVGGVASNAVSYKGPLSFALDVQPILNFGCAISGCHTGSSPPAGFNQSTYDNLRLGGINYGANVVIAGDSTSSEIIRAMRGTATVGRMPFGGPWAANGVPDSNIVKVGTWIKQGARDN